MRAAAGGDAAAQAGADATVATANAAASATISAANTNAAASTFASNQWANTTLAAAEMVFATDSRPYKPGTGFDTSLERIVGGT